MSGTTLNKVFVFLVTVLCSLPAMAAATGRVFHKDGVIHEDGVRNEIDIELRRLERSAPGRPSVSRPAAGELPPALRIEFPDDELENLRQNADGADLALETRAAVAATWTAGQRIKYAGRREIYRAGFYDGLKSAMLDPLLGRWDHREGIRAGRRAPEARLSGAAADEPVIVEVFDDYPLRSSIDVDFELRAGAPWRLYRSESYSDFYDHGWTDPESAFDYWLDHHSDRAVWRQLDLAERAQLENLFKQMFSRQLRDLSAGVSERAYSQGFDSGWDYGSLVAQEWSYRLGYHEGFETAHRDRAETAFHDHSPANYDDRRRSGL